MTDVMEFCSFLFAKHIDTHFSDWHLRIGEEEQAAKRRRTMVEEAVGRATMRILSARMAANQPKKLKRTEGNGANESGEKEGKWGKNLRI